MAETAIRVIRDREGPGFKSRAPVQFCQRKEHQVGFGIELGLYSRDVAGPGLTRWAAFDGARFRSGVRWVVRKQLSWKGASYLAPSSIPAVTRR